MGQSQSPQNEGGCEHIQSLKVTELKCGTEHCGLAGFGRKASRSCYCILLYFNVC